MKKTYQKPKIECHGSVEVITQCWEEFWRWLFGRCGDPKENVS